MIFSERLEKVHDIRKNLKDSILTILGAMSNLGISLEDNSNQASVDWIRHQAIQEDFSYPQVLGPCHAKSQ